ncbi:MAG TPA: response regulator [Usitatibacter sp.]|jgi:two-component system response regulator TtrR|nr:response regulator [Usitatibacter sp.]
MSARPTVYVVDDDSSTRELLEWLMKRQDLAVQAFGDARAFLKAYRPGDPGCLVLDLNMPGMGGLELQQYLKEHGVVLPLIFVSGGADVPKAVRAVREGAIDFIEKPFDYRRVVELVRQCIARDAQGRAARGRRDEILQRLSQLTQREREVMDQVVAGRTNREIGEGLAISVKTVEAHRARIMDKLGVDSVAELVQAVVAARAPS